MLHKYNAWGLYTDARDPRLIVPKRNPGFGWTINVGHRRGRVAVVTIMTLVVSTIIGYMTLG